MYIKTTMRKSIQVRLTVVKKTKQQIWLDKAVPGKDELSNENVSVRHGMLPHELLVGEIPEVSQTNKIEYYPSEPDCTAEGPSYFGCRAQQNQS